MENSNQPINPISDHTLNNKLGLTKREYFAGLAMQGLCAGLKGEFICADNGVDLASTSIMLADEILKQLEA